MSDATNTWWYAESGETLSEEEKIKRLQSFFADNGEAVYGKSEKETTITLEKKPFTIPTAYDTEFPDLKIVPIWAGKGIGWSVA